MTNHTLTLFLGVLPLLAFVIVESLLSPQWALISTIIVAFIEAVWTYREMGELDIVSWITLVTVLLLAIYSYRVKNPLFLKLQPALLSLLFAGGLIFSALIDQHLLLEFADKYYFLAGEEAAKQLKFLLTQDYFRQLLKINTWTMGVALSLHSALASYAAFKLSNWWWITVRSLGFYTILALSTLIARLLN